MTRVVWLADIHLDLASAKAIDAFLEALVASEPDAVLIGGDIAEQYLNEHLTQIAMRAQVPVYFVLGNHDYYGKHIADVRAEVRYLCAEVPILHWLPEAGVVPLTEETALLGHGAWSDGRYGDYMGSGVLLNDYVSIRDLRPLDQGERWGRIKSLADEAALYLQDTLPSALRQYKQVVLLTHSPPFREATWYMNEIPDWDDPYLPHFSCKAVGDVLLDIMPRFPQTHLLVLCGHTHSGGRVQMLDNLEVVTGKAEYGQPAIQDIFQFA
jgi:predicted MPP superfamily phosphohydrolase